MITPRKQRSKRSILRGWMRGELWCLFLLGVSTQAWGNCGDAGRHVQLGRNLQHAGRYTEAEIDLRTALGVAERSASGPELVRALGELGDRKLARLAEPALGDDVPEVMFAAARALHRLHDPAGKSIADCGAFRWNSSSRFIRS